MSRLAFLLGTLRPAGDVFPNPDCFAAQANVLCEHFVLLKGRAISGKTIAKPGEHSVNLCVVAGTQANFHSGKNTIRLASKVGSSRPR